MSTLKSQSITPVALNQPLKDEMQPKMTPASVYRPVYRSYKPRIRYPVHQYRVVTRPQPYDAIQRRGLPVFRSDIDKRLDGSSNMLRRTSEIDRPTFGYVSNQFIDGYQGNHVQSNVKDSNEEFEREIKIIVSKFD